MSVTAIKFSPELVAVGQAVSVLPIGSIPTNTDLRYYLLSAPPSSSLETLATYEANGKKLADIRLAVKKNGQGTFTPDAPGQYKVIVRPVTTYDFIPSYGGEIPPYINPSNPDLGRRPSKADNEEGTFVVGATVTAQVSDVPSGGETLWAYETLTRQIGFGQDTATVSIAAMGDDVVSNITVPKPVKLTAGQTPPSKVAVYDSAVLRALQSVEELTFGSSQIANHSDLLNGLVETFNEHIALDQWKVHTNGDATNTLSSTSSVLATLSSVQTRLDDIVAKYNAHRVLTAGPVHAAADTSYPMTVQPCTTEDEAIAYYEHVYQQLYGHATTPNFHDNSTPNEFVDGYFGWLAEPPTTLSQVAQAINGQEGTRWENYGLTLLYERHIDRIVLTAHYGSGVGTDTVNSVRFLSGTTQNLIATANALADALTRHIRNQDANGQAAVTPYHFEDAKKSRIPTRRASDARSLALCIEELWLCLESHLWSAGPPGFVDNSTAGERGQHQGRVWGYGARKETGSTRPTPLIRLQKAFENALAPGSNVSTSIGRMAARLRLEAGFT